MISTQIPHAKIFQYQKNNFIFSQEMIDLFFEDGFLVIENIFSKEEMNTLNKLLQDQLSKIQRGGTDWPLHHLEATKYPVFKALSVDKKLIQLLLPLLGNNIQLQHSKFAVKPPGEKKGIIHWHQDFAFFPHSNDSLVAIAISLTDVTPENGGMMMIRGSHKSGLLNHYNSDGSFAEKCFNESILNEQERYVFVCPKMGGISIHHCLTAHSSNDNLTNCSRNMVIFEYRASDAYQFADGVWQDTGLQICGEPSKKIRLGGKFLKKNTSGEILISLPNSDRYGPEFPFGDAYNQSGKMGRATSIFYKNYSNEILLTSQG